MNKEEKVTHLLMHEWKYISDFLDETWSIRTQTFYNQRDFLTRENNNVNSFKFTK